MKDWAAVVDAGAALPGIVQGTSYGKPALEFRGKMLAATTAPAPHSFVLHVALDEKDVAMETARPSSSAHGSESDPEHHLGR